MIYLALILLLTVTIVIILIGVGLKWKANSNKTASPHICVILGSGGHTTEMCEILRKFWIDKCGRMSVVTATSDHLS